MSSLEIKEGPEIGRGAEIINMRHHGLQEFLAKIHIDRLAFGIIHSVSSLFLPLSQIPYCWAAMAGSKSFDFKYSTICTTASSTLTLSLLM